MHRVWKLAVAAMVSGVTGCGLSDPGSQAYQIAKAMDVNFRQSCAAGTVSEALPDLCAQNAGAVSGLTAGEPGGSVLLGAFANPRMVPGKGDLVQVDVRVDQLPPLLAKQIGFVLTNHPDSKVFLSMRQDLVQEMAALSIVNAKQEPVLAFSASSNGKTTLMWQYGGGAVDSAGSPPAASRAVATGDFSLSNRGDDPLYQTLFSDSGGSPIAPLVNAVGTSEAPCSMHLNGQKLQGDMCEHLKGKLVSGGHNLEITLSLSPNSGKHVHVREEDLDRPLEKSVDDYRREQEERKQQKLAQKERQLEQEQADHAKTKQDLGQEQEKNENLTGENEDLTDQKTRLTAQNQTLRTDLKEEQGRADGLLDQNATRDAMIGVMINRRDNLQNQNQRLTNQNAARDAMIGAMINQRDNLQNQNQRLTNQNAARDAMIGAMINQRDNLLDQNQQLGVLRDRAIDQRGELQAHVDAVIQQLPGNNAFLDADGIADEVEDLVGDLDDEKEANQQLQAQNQQLENERDGARAAQDLLQMANTQLAADLKDERAYNQQLRTDYNQLLARKRHYKNSSTRLTGQLQQLQNERDAARGMNQVLDNQNQRLQTQNRQLTADLQNEKANNQNLAQANQQLKRDLKEAHDTDVALQGILDEFEKLKKISEDLIISNEKLQEEKNNIINETNNVKISWKKETDRLKAQINQQQLANDDEKEIVANNNDNDKNGKLQKNEKLPIINDDKVEDIERSISNWKNKIEQGEEDKNYEPISDYESFCENLDKIASYSIALAGKKGNLDSNEMQSYLKAKIIAKTIKKIGDKSVLGSYGEPLRKLSSGNYSEYLQPIMNEGTGGNFVAREKFKKSFLNALKNVKGDSEIIDLIEMYEFYAKGDYEMAYTLVAWKEKLINTKNKHGRKKSKGAFASMLKNLDLVKNTVIKNED
ncbi:MAG: hypothetical protein AAF471_01595 [Myxococcota bacterium]